MTKKDIPVYTDPDSFEELGENVKYPCSTNYMVYNPLTHRYYLTAEALINFGIDAERDYLSDAPNKLTAFVEEITDDVYGVVMRLAPFNYRYMCYLIASGRALHFPDRYAARKQFERALLYQAGYRIKNIDVREVNGIDLENNNNIYFKQLRRELRHVSPKTLDILQGLGLLFNGHIPEKDIINYREVM